MKLTKQNILTLPKGRYTDSGCATLMLAVSGRNQRSWVQFIRVGGRRVARGLGSVDLVSLEEARDIAARNRRIARIEKRDPFAGGRDAAGTAVDQTQAASATATAPAPAKVAAKGRK